MGNTCRCISQQSQSLSFHTRNHYNPNKTLPQTQKYKIIYDSIATGQPQDRYKQIASYIAECPQLHFVDPNFKYLQPTKNAELQQSRNIRKMYNFSKLKLSKVYEYNHDTPINIFQQRQVELCYLCSVFYFICQANQIKENIFVTTHINPHSAYIIRLFCNGQPCDVIVDEKLPTERQNIKYLSIHQPQEIWPFLLEKAWCKQIGGYDKARGLSPEDCFEEITGLPAYSMWFANRYGPKQVYQAITEALKRKYWIVLTAKSNLISGLKSRQVFYIQKYNQRTQTYKVRSPYTQFTLTNKNIQQKGQVQLTFNEILGYFQFLTIGVYEPGFVTTSYNFKSVKNQQNIFEINVHRPGKANIRVIQFYAEYLSEQEKLRYKYSPILMELYNQQFTLIQKCEGMLENLQGIRCSKLSEEIFIDLQPGVYYLRVQADWESQEHIKSANVVVYSPKNFMTIKKFEGDSIGLAGKLLAFTLEQPTIQIINGENQEVKIRYIQKNYGYIIGIQNLSQNKAQLKISFTQSENIRVNHHSLNGIELDVDLEGRGERVFEVLPQNPRKKYVLSSFDIVKV